MAGGACTRLSELPDGIAAVVAESRRAVMSTIDADGYAHSVPIVFALRGDELISPIDRKPKSERTLARVRNLRRNPSATVLVDRWDEDWTRLAWVMVRGRGWVEEPDERDTQALLARYPQFEQMDPHLGLIVIAPERIAWWSWA